MHATHLNIERCLLNLLTHTNRTSLAAVQKYSSLKAFEQSPTYKQSEKVKPCADLKGNLVHIYETQLALTPCQHLDGYLQPDSQKWHSSISCHICGDVGVVGHVTSPEH